MVKPNVKISLEIQVIRTGKGVLFHSILSTLQTSGKKLYLVLRQLSGCQILHLEGLWSGRKKGTSGGVS
jgi:hypothetical protein